MRPVLLLVLPVLLTAGCSRGPSGSEPRVSPITTGQIDSVLAAGRGRITLVNIWATWCTPCMEEIPALVKIRDEFSDEGVDVILISADDPGEADTLVLPALKKLGVEFATFVFAGPDQDNLIRFMHPDWTGALPASFLYDRTGRLAGWFYGERSRESFESEIRSLLDE